MADKPPGDNPALGEAVGKPATIPPFLKIDLEAAKGTLENIRHQEASFEQQEQKGDAPTVDPSAFKRPLSARGAPSLEQLHEAGVYRKVKKPSIRGQILEEGSIGWETMLDMHTGIRVVCSVKDYRSVKLVNSDFQTTRNLKFPRRGSKYTPPHTQRTFTFRDYAPLVFARIRQKFGLDPADYLDALTREAKMTCIRSPGKSASMFFYSYDGRFMVKTINKEECTKLMDILPAYYDHINLNPDTVITRFYGLHKVKPKKESSNYIVVMANVLNSAYFDMDEIYDLKGSTVGRTAAADEKEKKDKDVKSEKEDTTVPKRLDPNKIYKDLDFTRGFCFGPLKAKMLFDQLAADLQFLEENNIMDYSMLLGVHELTEHDLFARPDRPGGAVTPRRAVEHVASIPSVEYVSRFTHDWGGFCSSDAHNKPGTAIYFLGIIDILQDYNLRKQLEHGIKALQYEGDQISCVEPKLFASRFMRFMRDKLRALPSSEMRTLSDLQQAASAMHDDEPEHFGMLTPRRQYHRRLQLELEGKVQPTEALARPPPSPRFAVAAPVTAADEISSSDSSSSSEEPSSSQHSEHSGANGASIASGSSGGHKQRHRHRSHHHHSRHHSSSKSSTLLSVSPASPAADRRLADRHRSSKDGKSEKSERSDKSDSKSSEKSKSDSKSESKSYKKDK